MLIPSAPLFVRTIISYLTHSLYTDFCFFFFIKPMLSVVAL
uniref:Uncharacterized protein n=1 Tax=Rhizophora mucronata TaxID=61149 RepID=A0A2P2P3E7_RHIMU